MLQLPPTVFCKIEVWSLAAPLYDLFFSHSFGALAVFTVSWYMAPSVSTSVLVCRGWCSFSRTQHFSSKELDIGFLANLL